MTTVFRRVACALLSSMFLTALLFSQTTAVDHKSADEQDILASVIHHQMEEWVSEGDKDEAGARTKSDRTIASALNPKIFFISINGKDPTDEFLNRFRDIPRSIRKISSELPQKGPHTPKDRTTLLTGIIFSADTVKWLDQDTAEVEGGYYCGGLCAAGITFNVRREAGKWVVKGSKMRWIS
jgi:hypothetical protein